MFLLAPQSPHSSPAAPLRRLALRTVTLAVGAALFTGAALAQLPVAASRAATGPVTEANYRLAARFAPYRMRKLVYSTGVTPRWIKGSEKFWYEWESAQGKRFMIVDPVAGTKKQLFDNDRIAAELTRITKDPWDGWVGRVSGATRSGPRALDRRQALEPASRVRHACL